jgi:PPM family protein phosphatase
LLFRARAGVSPARNQVVPGTSAAGWSPGEPKAVEVSWYSWLWNLFRNLFRNTQKREVPMRDLDATDDYPTPTLLTLVPGALRLRSGVVSIVGNYREQNEDNYYVPGRFLGRLPEGSTLVEPAVGGNGPNGPGPPEGGGEVPSSPLDQPALFMVADGMGGQQAGEEASRMAIEIIPRAVSKRLGAEESDVKATQSAIRDAVAEANQEILGSSGAVTEFSNMGTTVVLALFRNDRVYVAGIGDSRAYRLRGGRLERLTKDHSLADALVEAGTITIEELPNHKFKNVLYLYLGSKDARGGPEDVRVLDVLPGDCFLLASDGLTGVVRDEDLTRILSECDDPQRAAQTLTDRALANDSKDNITTLVIHVSSEQSPPPPAAQPNQQAPSTTAE